MNTPTAYEISRIAVALRGRRAAKNPIEAIREAFGLWLVASYELENAKGKENIGSAMEAYPLGDTNHRPFEEEIKPEIEWLEREQRKRASRIEFGTTAENSQALKWLSDNGEGFKRFGSFEKAWKATFGEKALSRRSNCTAAILETFVKMRKQDRKRRDAKRKQQKRQNRDA